MGDLGRLLILIGLALVAVGLWLSFGPPLPWLGRLPGDFTIRRGPLTIYLPLGTSLVLSVLLTLILYLLRR